MLVFWHARLAMLSVPKTGSTAYEEALSAKAAIIVAKPPDLKHMPLIVYQRRIATLVEFGGGKPCDIFAVIRHPIDWLGSWYRYRTRDELIGHPNSTRGISFDDFIIEYLSDTPKPFACVGVQSGYVFDQEGKVGVKHLFKYENQSDIRGFLEKRLKTKLDSLPERNRSPEIELELDQDLEAALHFARPLEFAAWNAAR